MCSWHIDRATRYVWVKVLARRTAATVTQAVEFLAAFPQKVHTILTRVYPVCAQAREAGRPRRIAWITVPGDGITHRLIRPYHPQMAFFNRG